MADRQRIALYSDVVNSGTAGRAFLFLLLAFLPILCLAFVPISALHPAFFGITAGLLAVAILSGAQCAISQMTGYITKVRARRALHSESNPAFLTDNVGFLLDRNVATEAFPVIKNGQSIAHILDRHVADPDDTVARISRRAKAGNDAFEATGSGLLLCAKVAPGSRVLWTLANAQTFWSDTLAPELPEISVKEDGVLLRASDAAHSLLGALPETLGDLVVDLPIRQGGLHRIKTQYGEMPATVIVISSDGSSRKIAIVPRPIEERATGAAPVLAGPDLLGALPVPMLKIAADGSLIEANAQARTILNIEGDALPPLFELVEGMGRSISDWLADAAAGRGLLKPEIVRAVMPLQELYLQIALGRMIEKGEVCLVGILNDATELKTLEAQFVQSQKMQAIGQLAGGVAHDFNNLLTAISGHCDLLLLRHDTADPEYADLIQISQNSNRAASLVGQLLAFSRKQNLKPHSLDLRDTMAELAHLLNRLIGERIRLDVTHAPGPQTIRADRRQLEQVIINLVVNARDAMPEGGTISVHTHCEHLGKEVVRDRARLTPGDYVVIEVRDVGTGISPDGLPKIFEPFYTTKKTGEGTGLGLSTAYGIVKQTGGFIFVDSEVGEGTVFSLYFPANTQGPAVKALPKLKEVHPQSARGDGVVLLVEDEAPVRAFASRALRHHGYTVVEAENAEEALEILEDEALSVDVFVTDVIMPGMDGPTWVRIALKQRPDTRVVFMSGYAEEGRAEKQARIPNSVFLPKPFSLHQLTCLVQEQLR